MFLFFKKSMISHVQYHNFEYVYCSYGLTHGLSRTALRYSKLHVTVFSETVYMCAVFYRVHGLAGSWQEHVRMYMRKGLGVFLENREKPTATACTCEATHFFS